MDATLIARWQFGITMVCHLLFVLLTNSLSEEHQPRPGSNIRAVEGRRRCALPVRGECLR